MSAGAGRYGLSPKSALRLATQELANLTVALGP